MATSSKPGVPGMHLPAYLQQDIRFPPFYRVRMRYPSGKVQDIETAVKREVMSVLPETGIQSGQRVAVCVGSRGISNLPRIVKCLCRCVMETGAFPFIVPAMGSHGGATADGQKQVLARLGITETDMECPVVSSLDVAQIGNVFENVPVFFSRDAAEADHTILINRIKPHTKFKGDVESGLMKMICVGIGKHEGALTYHSHALKYGFSHLLQAMAAKAISNGNIRFGIGIVENGMDETELLEAIPAGTIFDREKQLLEVAKNHFPRLPFSALDVLVVCRAGKNISGSGMDPNVTGRAWDFMEDDFSGILRLKRLALLDLTEKTQGNAIGIGTADVITRKVYEKIDYETTLMNALTSLSLRKAFIPPCLPDDLTAIKACFRTIGPIPPERIRAVIIKDTLHLDAFLATPALIRYIDEMENAEPSDAFPLKFLPNGDLDQSKLWINP